MKGDFYGRGMSHPVSIDPAGGIRESAGIEKIEQSVRIILGTQFGERQMRPTFGCNLRTLVFSPNNEQTASLAAHYVRAGLAAWEPRIETLAVKVTNDTTNARLLIEVSYRVKATQDVRSLIYPFYLEKR
ncbi:GPW/gp25 family protein [soil metagenome]